MLLELGLRNFKAFGDELQTALFSKITLIYGPNSGGKSSLIQALLMLKQSRKEDYETWNRADEPTGKLRPRGEYVDLGSFSALIHKHDTKRDMEIALSYTGRGYSRARPRKRINAEKVTAQLTFSQLRASRLSDIVGMKYQISHGGDTIFDGLWESHIEENNRIVVRKALTIANMEISPDLIAISHLGFLPYLYVPGLTPEGGVNWQQASSQEPLMELVHELESRLTPELVDLLRSLTSQWSYDSVLDSITYLGPLRSYPERIYTVSSKNRNSTGVRGEFTSELLYSSPESIEKANKWFERFGIPYILAVDKFGDVALTGEYVSVALVDKHTNTTVTTCRRRVRHQSTLACDSRRTHATDAKVHIRTSELHNMYRTTGDSFASKTSSRSGRPLDRNQSRGQREAVDYRNAQRTTYAANSATHRRRKPQPV